MKVERTRDRKNKDKDELKDIVARDGVQQSHIYGCKNLGSPALDALCLRLEGGDLGKERCFLVLFRLQHLIKLL
jgi:hypothetical protein